MNASEIARLANEEHARKAEALAQDVVKEAFRALIDEPTLQEYTKQTDQTIPVCQSACLLLMRRGYEAEIRGASAIARWYHSGNVRIVVSGWHKLPHAYKTPDEGAAYRRAWVRSS